MTNVQPDAFKVVETSIFLTLGKTFKVENRKWLKGVKDLVKDGKFLEAFAAVDALSLARVYDLNKKRLTLLSYAAHNFGASRLASTGRLKTNPKSDKKLQLALSTLRLLVLRAEKWTKEAATTAIQLEQNRREDVSKSDGLVQKAVLNDFVSFIDGATEGAGLNSLQLTSSLHNSRVASYGFLTEAKLIGVTTYTINAVVDGRTSDLCLSLNGKTFEVETAYTFINNVLAVDDPDSLKSLHPWPTVSPDLLDGMSASELVAHGWFVPPFHPHCRSYLDKHESVPSASSISTPDKPSSLLGRQEQQLLTNLGIGKLVSNLGVGAATGAAAVLVFGSGTEEIRFILDAFQPADSQTLIAVRDATKRGDTDLEIMENLRITAAELAEIREYLKNVA